MVCMVRYGDVGEGNGDVMVRYGDGGERMVM